MKIKAFLANSAVMLFCLLLLSCGGNSGSPTDSENSISTDSNIPADPTDPAGSALADMSRANSYDNGWEAEWIANMKDVLSTDVGIVKTVGKVLQVGDSMTHSFAYGLWARQSEAGATISDLETIEWMHGNVENQNNGWVFSSGVPNLGTITAKGGMSWYDPIIDNIYVDPLTNDAQFAILMMNMPSPDPTDLTQIEIRVNQFISAGIMPILSTIPPRVDPTFDTNLGEPYNASIRLLAKSLALPLIDYSKEIVLRRPNGTWEDTLIGDGVHPSGGANGYDAGSDPYTPGGIPSLHITGDATLNSGYLLRTWLAVQKMKEIKAKVTD